MTSDPQRSDTNDSIARPLPESPEPVVPRTMTLPVHKKIGVFGTNPPLAAGLTLCDNGAMDHRAKVERCLAFSPSDCFYRYVQVLLCPSIIWDAPPVRMKTSTFRLFAAALRASFRSAQGGQGWSGQSIVELIDEEEKDLKNIVRIAHHSDHFHVTATLQDAVVSIPFWTVETLLSVIEAEDSHCRTPKEN